MLKYLFATIFLCGCAHTTQVVYPNHVAEHERALQVAADNAEHLQECRERFMMCGMETGGMTCGVQEDGRIDCLVAGEEAWKEVQACMASVHNQPYCKDVK
jgi:hypothetical protein